MEIATTQAIPIMVTTPQLGTLDSKEALEMQRLRTTHPLYDEYKPKWEYYLAAYEGGQNFINKETLFQFTRENDEDYAARIKRAHYWNYCDRLTDFFTEFIFAETIQRDGGSNAEWYSQFITNVNNKEQDVSEFMEEVSTDKDIYGMVYVLVDAPPRVTDATLSKRQQDELGIRPYWVLVSPLEILDWASDKFDKLTYIKRMQVTEQMSGNNKRIIERYTEWTPYIITITDIDITDPHEPRLLPAIEIKNEIEEVPFVPFRYKKSKKDKFMATSFLVDLADNNRAVLNETSMLDDFLYKQAFNFLAIQVDGSLPIAEQQDGDIGASNVMTYPKNANAPQYVSPSSEPADKISAERQLNINEMFKRAAQDTVSEMFNGGKQSGFSKAESFSKTVPKIATRAEVLEKGEMRLMALTMKYISKTWDGSIKYKDRYEVTNIADALTQLMMMVKDLQLPSETFVKTEMKRMIHEYDGKIPTDDMKKIEAEIDAMDWDKYKEVQKEALVGKKATSPSAQQKDKQSMMTTQQIKATSEKVPAKGGTKKLKDK